MREHMRESRPVRRELREAQNELRAAITTEEYVESDVVATLAEVRRASAELQESMHEQMVENLRHLAPEERGHVLGMMMRQDRGRRGPQPQHPGRPGGPPQG
jgi:Spy/CpxP family protein refolding chaperone